MIGIDPHSVYHFGCPIFLSLPDLTTKVNYLNDFVLNRLRTLLKLVTHYNMDISKPDSRWAEPFEEAALSRFNNVAIQATPRSHSLQTVKAPCSIDLAHRESGMLLFKRAVCNWFK